MISLKTDGSSWPLVQGMLRKKRHVFESDNVTL